MNISTARLCLYLSCLLLPSGTLHATELLTSTASYEHLPLERLFDGTVEAVKQATVSAETKGRVASVFFDVGDTVPAGALIFTLIPTEQRDALNQAEAKLLSAQANLEADTKEYNRMNELYQHSVVSKSDYERAKARFDIAKADVTSAEAGVKTAKEQLSYTEIHAPYGGIVSSRHVELGEAVRPGLPLISGFDPKAMRVIVTLPQAVAEKVKVIKKARVFGENGQVFIPSKIILYPTADPATSTVRVRLELNEMLSELYPGEFVNVGFTVGDVKRLLIPAQSVVYRSEVTGVYVIKDNIPSLRQIRLGNRFGDKIEVLAGLQEGEKVAIDPVAAGIVLQTEKREKGDD